MFGPGVISNFGFTYDDVVTLVPGGNRIRHGCSLMDLQLVYIGINGKLQEVYQQVTEHIKDENPNQSFEEWSKYYGDTLCEFFYGDCANLDEVLIYLRSALSDLQVLIDIAQSNDLPS